MIRLDDSAAAKVIIILLHHREVGYDLELAKQHMKRVYNEEIRGLPIYNPFPDDLRTVLKPYLIKHELPTAPEDNETNDILAILIKQLLYNDDKNYTIVVDMLIDMLNKPYSGNILNGSTLRQLRQALLLPTELSRLKNKVAMAEMSCTRCGHLFKHGELTVITTSRDCSSIVCLACTSPQYVRCPCCNNYGELTKRDLKFFYKKGLCSDCIGKKPEKVTIRPSRTPAVAGTPTADNPFENVILGTDGELPDGSQEWEVEYDGP